jgi:hypothetical protein
MDTTISIEPVSPINNSNKQWKSCCFSINQNAAKYFVKIGILSGLIIFSASMLVIDKDCNSQRNYGSLLMVCLGVFLPSPKMT